MAVSKLPDLENFDEAKETIQKFVDNEKNRFKKYYILLNNDKRYYTVFHRHTLGDFYNVIIEEYIPDVLIECLQNIGTIKMFEPIEDERIECWVNTPNDGCIVYLFFPYDEGVIEVK